MRNPITASLFFSQRCELSPCIPLQFSNSIGLTEKVPKGIYISSKLQMVKRKPVNAGTSRTSNSVPYPVTPIVTKEPIAEAFGPALRPISGEGSQTPSAGLPSSTSTSGMANSTIAWANGDTATTNTNNGLPPTLKAGDGIPSTVEAHRGADLPSSLQAGPIDNTPRSSFESQNSAERNTSREQFRGPDQATLGSSVQSHNSNNPFLRMRDDHGIQPNVSNVDDGSSAGIWGETAGEPTSKNSEAQASSKSFCTPHVEDQYLRLTDTKV